jgi:hypothetical protein
MLIITLNMLYIEVGSKSKHYSLNDKKYTFIYVPGVLRII